MTEPATTARNRRPTPWIMHALLWAILLAAAALRLKGIAFGLPALNDPDEPLFVMTALDMLRSHSLNPGWFGHPATTLIYALALIAIAIGSIGIATGHFANVAALTAAVYADPGIVFLPGRIFIAACGVACVYLTWRIGRRIGGPRLGLAGAAFLAANAIHIEYSQIIRSDMLASMFMLLTCLSALAILRTGRLRHYALAGLFVGLACASKWPAAVIALGPLAAGLYRLRRQPSTLRGLALFALSAPVALFLASPYLFLDYTAVIAGLGHEARPNHPGATGGNPLSNLVWYAVHPVQRGFGTVTALLALAGLLLWPLKSRATRIALLPGLAVFLVIVCVPALRWERWVVPLLPFLALAAAWSLWQLADRLRLSREIATAAILLLTVPMLLAARIHAAEQRSDTRQQAAAWVRAHLPHGSTILIEHAAFDLTSGPWRFRFPVGSAGCVDVARLLGNQTRYSSVEKLRKGSPLVDLGHLPAEVVPTCTADYAILTHYDRYRAEAPLYAPEIARYRQIIGSGTTLATFRPHPGTSSGPPVRIVKLR